LGEWKLESSGPRQVTVIGVCVHGSNSDLSGCKSGWEFLG